MAPKFNSDTQNPTHNNNDGNAEKDGGCCGMAGAFGMLESKYKLSVKVAEPLIRVIRGQPFGNIVVASGSSCRQQIKHLAPVRVEHMAEVMAEALI